MTEARDMTEKKRKKDISYHLICAIVGGTHLGIVLTAVSVEHSWSSMISLWLSAMSIPMVAVVYSFQRSEVRPHARWRIIMCAGALLPLSLSLLILSASVIAFILFWLAAYFSIDHVSDIRKEFSRIYKARNE